MNLYSLQILLNAIKIIHFISLHVYATSEPNIIYTKAQLDELKQAYDALIKKDAADNNGQDIDQRVLPFFNLKNTLKPIMEQIFFDAFIALQDSASVLINIDKRIESCTKQRNLLQEEYEVLSLDIDERIQRFEAELEKLDNEQDLEIQKKLAIPLKIMHQDLGYLDEKVTQLENKILEYSRYKASKNLQETIISAYTAEAETFLRTHDIIGQSIENRSVQLGLRIITDVTTAESELKGLIEVEKIKQAEAATQAEDAKIALVIASVKEKLLKKSPLFAQSLNYLPKERLTALYDYLNKKLVSDVDHQNPLSFYQLEAIMWCYHNMEITPPSNAEKLADKCSSNIAMAVTICGVKKYCPVLSQMSAKESHEKAIVITLLKNLTNETNNNITGHVHVAINQPAASKTLWFFGQHIKRRNILNKVVHVVSHLEASQNANLSHESKIALEKFKRLVSKESEYLGAMQKVLNENDQSTDVAQLKAKIIIAALEYVDSHEADRHGKNAVMSLIKDLLTNTTLNNINDIKSKVSYAIHKKSMFSMFLRKNDAREKALSAFVTDVTLR